MTNRHDVWNHTASALHMRRSLVRMLEMLGLVVLLFCPLPANGQSQNGPTAVAITSPRAGSSVGREIVVKGTAQLKDSEFLWLLARREDFDPLWYPQRYVRADPKTGEWSATATIGTNADVNWNFDVAAITVDASGHQQLLEQWTEAMTSGNWKPIRIPNTTSPPRLIKVHKTSNR